MLSRADRPALADLPGGRPPRSRLTAAWAGSLLAHLAVAALALWAIVPNAPAELPTDTIEMVFEPAAVPAANPEPEPPLPEPPTPEPPPPEPPMPEPPVVEPPPPAPDPAPPPLPAPEPLPLPLPPPRRPPAPRPLRPQPRPPRPEATAEPLPAGPAPNVAAAPTSAAATPAPAEVSPGWRNALGDWLQSHKVYPDLARRRGIEGRAVVRFTVGRDGRVLGLALTSSAGAAVLDDAARDLLTGARLPPFPPGMTQAQATVTVTIRYELER